MFEKNMLFTFDMFNSNHKSIFVFFPTSQNKKTNLSDLRFIKTANILFLLHPVHDLNKYSYE